ncbi:MAG: energy transducer TonB [Paludibacteraceae bacterium]|nr:energy transducer TonB [Paludibacteraceae bacterium]
MAKGKSICEYLKNLRKQIAEANGIDYSPRPCTYKGDCSGTCPACEREREYIESQLSLRQKWGAPLKIVELSVALASGAASASELQEERVDSSKETRSCPKSAQLEDHEDGDDYVITGALVLHRPKFPGGDAALMAFLKENIRYPEEAREKGIQGRVRVTFLVCRDGSIADVKIQQQVHPLLDAEAVRVVNLMPKWEYQGKENARFSLPISFALENDSVSSEKKNQVE